MYNEICTIMQHHKIMQFGCKEVKRENVFAESSEVPKEGRYMKVVYPSKCKFMSFTRVSDVITDAELPQDLSGDTFSHCFGTKSSPLELFLLKRKLFGPSWLSISKSSIVAQKTSWCKLEYAVEDPKHIRVSENPFETPKLCTMSLKVRTMLNPKTKVNEVIMISWLFHRASMLNIFILATQLT